MASKEWISTSSGVYTTAANWSDGAAPGAADNVMVGSRSGAAITGSDQSGTALTSFVVTMGNLYAIGSTGTELKISATTIDIGVEDQSGLSAAGSQSINLNGHTTQTTLNVYNTASSGSDSGLAPFRFKNVNASSIANIYKGIVGIATNTIGDVATIDTISVLGSSARVFIGSGVTLETLKVLEGICQLNCAVTTNAIVTDGELTSYGVGLIAAMDLSGKFNANHTGAAAEITTINLYDGADLDLRNNGNAFAIGTINVYGDNHVIRQAYANQLSWTTLNRYARNFIIETNR